MVLLEEPPDASLARDVLARAVAGDPDAFCQLTEPLQCRLLRQAVALTGDVAMAEDLVSETLVEAWKCLARYQPSCRLSTWLYSILLHRHHKWLRRKRRWPISLAWLQGEDAEYWQTQRTSLPATDLSPAEALAVSEAAAQLHACLARLPAKHREVIRLRFFEDASLPDMAAVLGCSSGTVKSRLHHALEKLRQMKMNLPGMTGDTQL